MRLHCWGRCRAPKQCGGGSSLRRDVLRTLASKVISPMFLTKKEVPEVCKCWPLSWHKYISISFLLGKSRLLATATILLREFEVPNQVCRDPSRV